MTVLRLEHLDVRVVAIKAHRSLGPLTADRAAADDRENEISENFKVAPGDTDVLELDGPAANATETIAYRIPTRSGHLVARQTASRRATSPAKRPR
jgi:hypothetical protein